MGITKTVRHQDYELMCGAKSLDNGKFAPLLVVAKQTWPRRPRTIAVRCDDCPTEENAIHSAYTQGIEWVLNYG